jgi:hypothetical protein
MLSSRLCAALRQSDRGCRRIPYQGAPKGDELKKDIYTLQDPQSNIRAQSSSISRKRFPASIRKWRPKQTTGRRHTWVMAV